MNELDQALSLTVTLDGVVAAFQTRLYMPDSQPIEAVLAAVIANRIEEGDPVWLVIVAGSSCGKTELVNPLDGLGDVRLTGQLTVASGDRVRPEKGQFGRGVGGAFCVVSGATGFGMVECSATQSP